MMKRNRSLLAVILALGMILALTACGSDKKDAVEEPEQPETVAEEPETEEEEPEEDGPVDSEEADPAENTADTAEAGTDEAEAAPALSHERRDGEALPADVQAAYDKAMEKMTGMELKPVAFVSEQVVSGVNYMILCERPEASAAEARYIMIIVYQDLNGNAMVMTMKDFDVRAFIGGEGPVYEEGLAGGWRVPEGYTVAKLGNKAKAAFDHAVAGQDKKLVPMAQLEGRTNGERIFLCTEEPGGDKPAVRLEMIVVHGDGEDAEIAESCLVDPGFFNE